MDMNIDGEEKSGVREKIPQSREEGEGGSRSGRATEKALREKRA